MKTVTMSLPIHPVNLSAWEDPNYKAYFWFLITIGLVIFIFLLIAMKIIYSTYCQPHGDCPCHRCDPHRKHRAWGNAESADTHQLLHGGPGSTMSQGKLSKLDLSINEPGTKILTEENESNLIKRPSLIHKPTDLQIINEVGDSGISSPSSGTGTHNNSEHDNSSPSRIDIPDYQRRYSYSILQSQNEKNTSSSQSQLPAPGVGDATSGSGFQNTQV